MMREAAGHGEAAAQARAVERSPNLLGRGPAGAPVPMTKKGGGRERPNISASRVRLWEYIEDLEEAELGCEAVNESQRETIAAFKAECDVLKAFLRSANAAYDALKAERASGSGRGTASGQRGKTDAVVAQASDAPDSTARHLTTANSPARKEA